MKTKKCVNSLPEKASVACQGTVGAYSQIAAQRFFAQPEIMYTRTFDGVFNAVNSGLCKYGVLPLENSNAGSVTAVYHLMKSHEFYIAKSLKLPVSHCLLAKNRIDINEIKNIYTHEQAASQCSMFIEQNPSIKLNICENTALAAQYVSSSGNTYDAAIASEACANLYGLSVLARGIENHSSNYTRFILISKTYESLLGSDKLSILLTLEHKPGALLECLKIFAGLGINLTKIESIPIAGTDFEFMFYFDCYVGADNADTVDKLLITLNKMLKSFSFLGYYSEIQPFSI